MIQEVWEVWDEDAWGEDTWGEGTPASPGVLRLIALYAPTVTATAQYQPTLAILGRFEG